MSCSDNVISTSNLTNFGMLSRRSGLPAIGGFSCCCRRRQEKGKGRDTKVHNVQDVIGYLSYLWGGQPWADYHKNVPPHDVIKMSNFCNKIFRVSYLQGVKFPVFQLTLLATTVRSQS